MLLVEVVAYAEDVVAPDADRQEAGTTLDADLLDRATADHKDTLARAITSVREARALRAKERLTRTGEWQSQRFDPESRGWHVDLEHNPRTGNVEGTIRITGSRSLASATRLRGWMQDSSVTGTIETDGGDVLGTFSGTVSEVGMAGTYSTKDGDEGEWSYRDWKAQLADEISVSR